MQDFRRVVVEVGSGTTDVQVGYAVYGLSAQYRDGAAEALFRQYRRRLA